MAFSANNGCKYMLAGRVYRSITKSKHAENLPETTCKPQIKLLAAEDIVAENALIYRQKVLTMNMSEKTGLNDYEKIDFASGFLLTVN